MTPRRFIFLFHRWSGIGFCVLMLLWLVSGVVMLYVGYPKLLPQERWRALPALDASVCCAPVAAALAASPAPSEVQALSLVTIGGALRYRIHEGSGAVRVVDAATGRALPGADADAALAGARAFLPGAHGRVEGLVDDDRWTHGRALDPHRPLYRVQMDDAQAHVLYVSSSTGEVMLDAPRAQRLWNFAGAWLHWLYMFRSGSGDPVWTWLLIALSAAGTLSVAAGMLVGLWRWRFLAPYKTGQRTPYREWTMRWHHLAGLAVGSMAVLWMFSGLMSMNPLGLFNAAHGRPDLAAYRAGTPGTVPAALEPGQALALLQQDGFSAVELEWKVLAGQPHVLARDAAGAARLLLPQGPTGAWAVATGWPAAALVQAAGRLRPAPIAGHELRHGYDAYYYARQNASMYADRLRPLPVLRVEFTDAGRTVAYIDPASGDVVHSMDATQRAGRWLFNLLHSWDWWVLLRAALAREAVFIALSGALALLAGTGVAIGLRRLRIKFGG